MDLFDSKSVKPMFPGSLRQAPFDDEMFLFEAMLSGGRCIAYASDTGIDLLDHKGESVLSRFPEFKNAAGLVGKKCVLDGEIVVFGKRLPDPEECRRRRRMACGASAQKNPATFVAYDIVYCDGKDLSKHPLLARKDILQAVATESELLTVGQYMENSGVSLFSSARESGLAGIVGKHIGGRYHFGKSNPSWVAISTQLEDFFIVCGYVDVSPSMMILILGQYDPLGIIVFCGLAPLRNMSYVLPVVRSQRRAKEPPFNLGAPIDLVEATWLTPSLVCVMRFTARNENGMVLAPEFKKLRLEMMPDEALVHTARHNIDPHAPELVLRPPAIGAAKPRPSPSV